MSPRVSVVIAAYNHARFVGQTLESVLGQSFQDFEIVICDDGSQDGTPEVIRRYTDPRISLEVFPKNCGAVVATNTAIRKSKGEYVAVLNSDDYFLPGKLEKQVTFLDADPHFAAVFALPRFVDEDGAPVSVKSPFRVQPLSGGHSSRAWLRHFFFYGNCLCHPSMMIRRTVYDAIGLYDPRLANLPDFEMWVRICRQFEIRVMPEELVAFRMLSNQTNMSAPRVDTRLRVIFETNKILAHYGSLPQDALLEIFERDIRRLRLDTQRESSSAWILAELALDVNTPAYRLFALDTLYQALRAGDADYARFIKLTGSVDPFREREQRSLLQRMLARFRASAKRRMREAVQPRFE